MNEPTPSAEVNQTTAPPAAKALLNRRVLVVDDSETNRKLLQLMLRSAGAIVQHADNGEQAIQRAGVERFDIILMDMQMPILDGYAATTELRRRGVKIPIIA